jgi:hypothetical protein
MSVAKAKGKGEVVPVLFLIEHHAMKAYWSDSLPGRFTPRERASGTHWIGG